MTDAHLSSVHSQLKVQVERGNHVSAISVQELVKAGHEICLAAQKCMCFRMGQPVWLSQVELKIREEVSAEKMAESSVDVLGICQGVLCLAAPRVAAPECVLASAAVAVTKNVVEYALQVVSHGAMKSHLNASDEAQRVHTLALANFCGQCVQIFGLLRVDEQTSLRFCLFVMQFARQFEDNEQFEEPDSQSLLKFLTCEECMHIIRQQSNNGVWFNESLSIIMKWGTKT